MHILFLHNNFPAQFRHLAIALAQNPENLVVYGTRHTDNSIQLPGVRKVTFALAREVHPHTHHYLRYYEESILHGQAVYRLTNQLKSSGFVPDIVCAHSGWGTGMFMKDAFPETPLICYFEWFGRAHGSDMDFDPMFPLTADNQLWIRASNASILVDLVSCNRGISPTWWQHSQFPQEFHSKITVMHDGIDTHYFQPEPGLKLVLPNLDLSQVNEIITYVSRGMDSYRGFPQFMEAIALVLNRRPNCHVVIVGADQVAYGPPAPDGKTYKEWMLERVELDQSRVHFVGTLPYGLYKKVLQASSVHVYLTRPFVLSWSLMEAMSVGCLIVASDTAPVREVIEDGKNGLLVPFFDVEAIANRIETALDQGNDLQALRDKARDTILNQYAQSLLLPQQIQLLQDLSNHCFS